MSIPFTYLAVQFWTRTVFNKMLLPIQKIGATTTNCGNLPVITNRLIFGHFCLLILVDVKCFLLDLTSNFVQERWSAYLRNVIACRYLIERTRPFFKYMLASSTKLRLPPAHFVISFTTFLRAPISSRVKIDLRSQTIDFWNLRMKILVITLYSNTHSGTFWKTIKIIVS